MNNKSSTVARSLMAEPEIAYRSRTAAAHARRPDVNRSYVIPVLTRALVIMKLLGKSDFPMSVAQVCQATGYPKTTVYRILRTLSAFGYIPQGSDGVYSFTSMSIWKEIDTESLQ